MVCGQGFLEDLPMGVLGLVYIADNSTALPTGLDLVMLLRCTPQPRSSHLLLTLILCCSTASSFFMLGMLACHAPLFVIASSLTSDLLCGAMHMS